MSTAKRTTIMLFEGQIDILQKIALENGYPQTRGTGSGVIGSLSALIQAIANKELLVVKNNCLTDKSLENYKTWFPELAGWTKSQLDASKEAESNKYTLYGPTPNSGKSYWNRWEALNFLLKLSFIGVNKPTVAIICETHFTLVNNQINFIEKEFPNWLGAFDEVERNKFILHPEYGGGILYFLSFDNLSVFENKFFDAVSVDSIQYTSIKIFDLILNLLKKSRLPRLFATSLATSSWVRDYWVEKKLPTTLVEDTEKFKIVTGFPVDMVNTNEEIYRVFLSTLTDNLKRAWSVSNWFTEFE